MASVLFRLLLCLALLVDGTLPAFAMARLAQADAEMASMPAMPPGHDCDHAGAADAVTAPPASPAEAAQAHDDCLRTCLESCLQHVPALARMALPPMAPLQAPKPASTPDPAAPSQARDLLLRPPIA